MITESLLNSTQEGLALSGAGSSWNPDGVMAAILPGDLSAVQIEGVARNQTASPPPITIRDDRHHLLISVTGDVGPVTLVLVATDAARISIEAVDSVLVGVLDLLVETVVIG